MTDHTDLMSLLDIERLEEDLFRGVGGGGETAKRIYGGHVIAQALVAAYRTVEDRACHSMHAYFIRPGDPTIPVIYEVDRARDGGSFTTRRVVAIQHGRQIFNLAASFHKAEDSWTHQHAMPDAPAPDTLETREALRNVAAQRLPEKARAQFTRPSPIEVRDVAPLDMFDPGVASDSHAMWFRLKTPVDAAPWVQHCLLAYASDMSLLSSGMRPHGLSWLNGEVMGASLDHALWFHAPLNFGEWHLYSMDSPFSGGARSFNRGQIFASDGRLVASVAQEGLMRPITKKTTG